MRLAHNHDEAADSGDVGREARDRAAAAEAAQEGVAFVRRLEGWQLLAAHGGTGTGWSRRVMTAKLVNEEKRA